MRVAVEIGAYTFGVIVHSRCLHHFRVYWLDDVPLLLLVYGRVRRMGGGMFALAHSGRPARVTPCWVHAAEAAW